MHKARTWRTSVRDSESFDGNWNGVEQRKSFRITYTHEKTHFLFVFDRLLDQKCFRCKLPAQQRVKASHWIDHQTGKSHNSRLNSLRREVFSLALCLRECNCTYGWTSCRHKQNAAPLTWSQHWGHPGSDSILLQINEIWWPQIQRELATMARDFTDYPTAYMETRKLLKKNVRPTTFSQKCQKRNCIRFRGAFSGVINGKLFAFDVQRT